MLLIQNHPQNLSFPSHVSVCNAPAAARVEGWERCPAAMDPAGIPSPKQPSASPGPIQPHPAPNPSERALSGPDLHLCISG